MARGATHLCASGSREVHKVGLRLKDNREALMEYTRCPLDNYIVRWTTTLTATLFHAARPEGGAGAARAAWPFSLAADNLAAGNSWDRNPFRQKFTCKSQRSEFHGGNKASSFVVPHLSEQIMKLGQTTNALRRTRPVLTGTAPSLEIRSCSLVGDSAEL